MKNKFTLGVIAGITSLSLAVPILAQVSSAASSVGTSTGTATSISTTADTRPAPTTQTIQDMIARDTAFLTNADAIVELQKTATQAHKDALTAAASLTDEMARAAAVQKANDTMHATIEAAITANPNLKMAMMPFGGHGGPGRGHGSNMADISAKLGMTETELKAALDSGKTIEQIAQEKGVTLPARPSFMGDTSSQTSSAQ